MQFDQYEDTSNLNYFVKYTFSHGVITAHVPLQEVVQIETWVGCDGDGLGEERDRDVLPADRVVERSSNVVLDVLSGSRLRVRDDEPRGSAGGPHLQYPVTVDVTHACHFGSAWRSEVYMMTKLGFRSILTTEIVWIVSAIRMASAMWIVNAALFLLFNKL